MQSYVGDDIRSVTARQQPELIYHGSELIHRWTQRRTCARIAGHLKPLISATRATHADLV